MPDTIQIVVLFPYNSKKEMLIPIKNGTFSLFKEVVTAGVAPVETARFAIKKYLDIEIKGRMPKVKHVRDLQSSPMKYYLLYPIAIGNKTIPGTQIIKPQDFPKKLLKGKDAKLAQMAFEMM